MNLPDFLNLFKLKRRNLLRITIAAGVILLFITGVTITFFYLTERTATKTARQLDNFARSLRQYDILFDNISGDQGDYLRLSRELDRIEKTAIAVESWLSVLKRKRTLSRLFPSSADNYKKSVKTALEAYPMSQPVAAIAAESLIKDTAIDSEAGKLLRSWTELLTDSLFQNLRLYLHVMLGDFGSPQKASVLPLSIQTDGTEDITNNLTILKVVRSDISGALQDIQTVMYSSAGDNFLYLAGEFYYDFGELERSAEIFSMIKGEKALVRQADALFLAGYEETAKTIWLILSDLYNPQSIYNLGITSENNNDALNWFKKLIDMNETSLIKQYALIRYSRLFDYSEAIALLQNTEGLPPQDYPFIDLEICKRQASGRELGRQIAEAWFLLDRHHGNEEMYKWTAWLFLLQRNYEELKILLNRGEVKQFTDQWVNTCKAYALMFDGELDKAENLLESIPQEEALWTVHANLGKIKQVQHSASGALEQYRLALNKTKNPKTASRIYVNIAWCYSAMKNPNEALTALLYALELDSENMTARFELDRLMSY